MFSLVSSAVDQVLQVPIKLSDDDPYLVWTGIVLPAFAAIASVFVAAMSVRIAKRAKDIAEQSEIARVTSEADRAKFEREQRLTTALRELMLGVGKRMKALTKYDFDLRVAMNHEGSFPPVSWARWPVSPLPAPVVILVAAAMLEANQDDERRMLIAARRVIETAGDKDDTTEMMPWQNPMTRKIGVEMRRLEAFCIELEEWRSSDAAGRHQIVDNWNAE